jgi:hypothetical protein
MKRVLALSLLALAGLAQAHDKHHVQCDLHSDYQVRMQGKAFVFTRDDGPARHVAIGGSRLWIDGEEVALTADDRVRVQRFEARLNAMVPQMREVVVEATDIAFTALTEVARGFANEDSRASIARLEATHRKLQAELQREPVVLFSEDLGKHVIKPLITEFVPVIVGGAVRSTLDVAFSGDERKAQAFERRMDAMGDEIDRKVEARAEALEPKAEALCAGTRELDQLENGLTLRLADGEPLDLLRTSSEH